VEKRYIAESEEHFQRSAGRNGKGREDPRVNGGDRTDLFPFKGKKIGSINRKKITFLFGEFLVKKKAKKKQARRGKD